MEILGYVIAGIAGLAMVACSLVVFVDIKDLNKQTQDQDSEDN